MLSIVVTGFMAEDITAGGLSAMESANAVMFHTEKCEAAGIARERGIAFVSLDDLYEITADFDEHIRLGLERLASFDGVFCVMDTSDELAKALLRERPETPVIGGVYDGLLLRAQGGCRMISAMDCAEAPISSSQAMLVTELDNRILAGEVKVKLCEAYGDEAEIFFRKEDGRIIPLKAEKLDRLAAYDHRCACLINPQGENCTDFEMLKKRACGCEPPEDETEDSAAKKMAQAAVFIARGEAAFEFTAADIFAMAAEEIRS